MTGRPEGVNFGLGPNAACYAGKGHAMSIAFGGDAGAGVVELVDTLDLGSSGASHGGSNPSARTTRQRTRHSPG